MFCAESHKTSTATGVGLARTLKAEMNPAIAASSTLFAVLSGASIALSGAPPRVHAVNIGCFFVAFVFATILAERRMQDLPHVVLWLLVGAVGLFLWDLLSTFVIAKVEVFTGWYILYPLGLVGLVLLQLLALATSKLQPFNKRL